MFTYFNSNESNSNILIITKDVKLHIYFAKIFMRMTKFLFLSFITYF